MVIKEVLNEHLVKHYSDRGVKLLQVETGVVYDEAIDVVPCKYTYKETDKPIETEEYEEGQASE